MIARFTRDAASKYVWAVMALVAIGALAFAIMTGNEALDRERAIAQSRALRYVEEALDPRLEGSDLDGPITGEAAAALEVAVERTILADERLTRVRIWSADGPLLFSTDRSDTPGSDAGLNDALLRRVSREGVLTRSGVSDTGGEDDPERSLLRTYVPLRATAIAEIDQTDEGTLAAARTEWMYYEILAGAMLLLFLVLTGLSLRDPIERINTGVPFASSSVPAGFSLIDDDRLHAVQEVYRLASERVGRLQQKLEESEEARRRLEGDIQRALSKATVAPQVGAPSTPASVPAPAAAPEPAVVRVPESDVVATPLGDARTAAPAGPLARASRDQKPPTATSLAAPKPAAENPERARRPQRPKPEAPAKQEDPKNEEPVAAASQEVMIEEAAQAPERRVAAMATTSAGPSPSPTAADIELEDAEAHEAALEMFIRLTESDRQTHDTTEVDQGAVRAALARTAARKKPGGERLQPHDAPEKSSDGPPRS